MDSRYVGVDIGKERFAACFIRRKNGRERPLKKVFRNTESDYQRLVQWAGDNEVKLHFIMESTGVYYEKTAYWLIEHGMAVSVVNPAHAKAFGASLGARTKTDHKDAYVLCLFGERHRPKPWSPPDTKYRRLVDYWR